MLVSNSIGRVAQTCYPPPMSDKESDQRRDELLLRLLHSPPEARAERKRPREKPETDASRSRVIESSLSKPSQ